MSRGFGAFGWFLAALGLYGLSAATGPIWGDSAKLTIYALHRYLPSANPGDHPGFTVLAQLWFALTPGIDPVRSLHLLSATTGAIAVALLYLFVARSASDSGTPHAAAAVLLVAHSFWWASAVTETYAPAVALILVTALLAERGAGAARSLAAGSAAGMAIAVHGFAVLLVLPLLLVLPGRRLAFSGLGLLLGSAPVWLALFSHPTDPLTGHLASGTSSWAWVVSVFLDPHRFLVGMGSELALLLFGLGPLWLVGILGARRGFGRPAHPRPALAAATTAGLVVVLAVYSPYRLHLMVVFPTVALLLLVPPRLSLRLRIAHVGLQTAVYLVAPVVATSLDLGSLQARQLPERDNARYFLSPLKRGEDGARRYGEQLLRACPPNAVVLADFNAGAVLRLVQERESLRPDVVVVPTAIDEALAARDPGATLATHVAGVLSNGHAAVLADRWAPYYRTAQLRQRGFVLEPCGPGLLVTRSATAMASEAGSSPTTR